MDILVNAIPLSGLQTGIGRTLRCLYQAVEKLSFGPLPLCISYFDGWRVRRDMPKAADPKQWQTRTDAVWKLPDLVVLGRRILRQVQVEWRLRRVCRQASYDIYHEASFFPAAQHRVPTVFSLFDFSLDRFAHTHPRERVWFYRLFFARRLRYASHIVTISHAVLNEARARLRVADNRLTAVPLAPDPIFSQRSSEEVAAVRRRFGLDGDYWLFVGSLEPRKNLRLFWDALRRLGASAPMVLAGWHGWGDKSWLREAVERGGSRTPRCVLTGFVDDATLAALYSGATALVYPSLYEGFGLPVLEAMACGCPVVCSNIAALRETAGDAALFIEPHDPDGLAAVLDDLLSHGRRRKEYRQRGFERARQFSWEKTARAMVDVFQKVVEKNA
ncbi:glycosyltransferase family 4 protein [Desulfosoma caldarium]|uniref:Alpha-1,3-rhamnosyl/mannosyltransferase n=1 Tax=Desulfosoma caldarium TaxID=610254 RepID=A0A3N1VMJ0_9BACT|nr:glycosyltransferase family 1 protein [Desulfosoma caldarium]ROR03170.1 alpha-1,3-rhamnosyl/mannosyltransferase [Desulfosoma caldarium]